MGRPDAAWPAAPEQLPPLSPAVVHVWAVRLDAPASQIDALHTTLSSDERDRAGRFYFDRDRRRYICARGVLRLLLSRYLVEVPEALTFSYGPNGKPALSGRFFDALTFNVSHSHELALIAIGRGVEMGVDVEAVRPLEDANDIASRFFSPREAERLRSLPDTARMDAFFECWTRKEAYLKALGSGLAKPLDAFEVTFAADAPALQVYGDAAETARWSIRNLSPVAGYTGALVTQGPVEALCWEWMPDAHARRAVMALESVETI